MTEFKLTIQRFKILPNGFVSLFSWLFVASELIIVFIIWGGTILLGFALSILLLSAFSIALISVLVRKIQTSCNCFGSNEKLVAPYDIGRNIIFILCASTGLHLYSNGYGNLVGLNLLELGLIGLTALAFVLIVINLNEIMQVLK